MPPVGGEGAGARVALSFRDPAGQVFRDGKKILRRVAASESAWTRTFIESAFFRKGLEAGYFPATAPVAPPDGDDPAEPLWLEHARLDFPAYPHEWIPDQLFEAGRLTIDLALGAAGEGLEVKDATPYNVLFDKGRATFCDVLSFVPRQGSAVWLPFAQFQRTFILPLYMYRHFGSPPHRLFLEKRDGLEPTEVYQAISWLRGLKPLELQLVTLPALLAKRSDAVAGPRASASSPPSAKRDFVFRRLLEKLRKQLHDVEPPRRTDSAWGEYEGECDHYSSAERVQKGAFVKRAIAAARPAMVLDLGANAGEYSRIAAAQGSHVVAADADVNALQALFRRNSTERLPITPVVLNIARPTPGVGWRNSEVESFLERAKGRFDMVLGLAVIHHLMVTERVPLEQVVELFADLDSTHVVLEWVDPSDEKFRQIAGVNLPLYAGTTEARFRAALGRHFRIRDELPNASGSRRLFWCTRASA